MLSCQQDYLLGDSQQNTFKYFYNENLHRNETLHANSSDEFGFSDLKLSICLCLFHQIENLAKEKCQFSLQEYLK